MIIYILSIIFKRMVGLKLLPSFLHVMWRWLPVLRPVLPVTPTMIPG